MVTGLRALAGGVPSGECELHRTCMTGSMECAGDGDDNEEVYRPAILHDVFMAFVFMAARDSATRSWWGSNFPTRGFLR